MLTISLTTTLLTLALLDDDHLEAIALQRLAFG